MDEMHSNAAIGGRLKRVRLALDLGNQNEVAQRLGVAYNRWNNWESGGARIPVDAAIAFCRMTGANLDYIYRGEMAYLPVQLAKLLAAQEKKMKAG